MDMEGQPQTPKLLDQVRNVLRLHHYSIHTERSYIDWIKRYVHFHQMRCREDLADGEKKIEAFLTDLAVQGKVAASTQNQAMNALVFLYKKVLAKPLDGKVSVNDNVMYAGWVQGFFICSVRTHPAARGHFDQSLWTESARRKGWLLGAGCS